MRRVDKRRMCPHCRAFITTDDKICPYCETRVEPKAVERRSTPDAMGGLIPHARFTTVVILLINTGLYAATVLHSMRSNPQTGALDLDPNTLLAFGAKYGPSLMAGEWWRLITAGFLHGGLLHILMNSWVLFDIGTQVEESFGTARYLVIYVASTITGFLGSFYWSPTLSVGSSAGIFGLIGAMIAMGLRERSSYGSAVWRMYGRLAVYGLIMGLLFPYTDNGAHIGGLIGGFVLCYAAGTPGYSRGVERMWQITAGFAVLITALAFGRVFLGLMA